MMRSMLGSTLLLAWAWAAPLEALADPFDEDPLENPDWELYEPVPAAAYSVEDGWWQVTIPGGINLDTWTTVNRAPQLRRAVPAEDFVIETRVRLLGSGDPASPIWPPLDESYLAALMVSFSTFDLFHWGPYRGTYLRLERSGQNDLCHVDPGLREVSLQIRKVGSTYTFSYRGDDGEDWIPVCEQFVDEDLHPPQYVGIIFKTWNPIPTMAETFAFDYFTLQEPEEEPARIAKACGFPEPDAAWIGMPYVRPLAVLGTPLPEVTVTRGPAELAYDPVRKALAGWVPDAPGTLEIAVKASNPTGTDTASWTVVVAADPEAHDEEFDDDPAEDPFWELYVPQGGVLFSMHEWSGESWWRLEVPRTGDMGLNFDHWTTVDRAVQLRHPVGGDDFLIETAVRIDPDTAPPPSDPFYAALMISFGPFDVFHWGVAQQRTLGGGPANVLLERTGMNNLAWGYVPDLLAGGIVGLRIEKVCDAYGFFYRGEGDESWTLAGTRRTADPPEHVGIMVKNWGGGAAFTADFDYFDILEPEGGPPPEVFVRGDVDASGVLTIGDAINLLNHLFGGGAAPVCPDAADVDDTGVFTIGDAVFLLNYLFASGAEPHAPGPAACGRDPTPEDPLGPCAYPPDACP